MTQGVQTSLAMMIPVGISQVDGGTCHCLVALVGVGEREQGGSPAVKTTSGFGSVKLSGVLMNWKLYKTHDVKMAKTDLLAMIARPHQARDRSGFAVYTRIKSRTSVEGILAEATKLAPLHMVKVVLSMAMMDVDAAWAHPIAQLQGRQPPLRTQGVVAGTGGSQSRRSTLNRKLHGSHGCEDLAFS